MQSCDKELDVRPKQSIDASTALTTASDVDAALIGTYSLMSAGSLYGTNLFMIADLQASEGYASWRGTFQGQRDIANKTMTRDNAEAARTWNQAYRTINMANVVLDAVDVVTDQELQDQYKGEALFIRGALHFELVRYFAKPWGASAGNDHIGIVLRTEPHLTEAPASPRSTVKQVYDQVIADLTEAASKLPEENGRRVDKYTALAFLARVYLQQSDFVKALDASNQVIESGMYEMNNDLLAAFTQDNTPEVIWEIEQDVQNNAGTSNDGLATFYGSIPGVGRGDVRIDAAFVNSYAANDLRKTAYYYVGTGARPGNLYSAKWTSFSQNLPVVRLAEMYLVRAECNIRLGSSVGDSPTNDLAQIRNMARVGLPPIANPTLADVLKERTYELAFEGLRIHDIKRLKGSTGTFAWDNPNLVLPIPAQEVSASSGVIVQNEGY
ncbi:MAG TPA: RagB/SusD family nutrient uptake outer membrane protein [Flavisolibacter sp.]